MFDDDDDDDDDDDVDDDVDDDDDDDILADLSRSNVDQLYFLASATAAWYCFYGLCL